VSEDDGFVRRWSRLKRTAQDEKIAEEAVELETASIAGDLVVDEAEADTLQDEEIAEIAPEDLPDIDTLTAESDFTPFMQAGVPEDLKRLALRKLWKSDPIFANVDGLNDYDEDFKLAMEIGTAFIEKARAAGAKFIGEHEDDPEELENAEEEQIAADAESDEEKSRPVLDGQTADIEDDEGEIIEDA